MQSTEFAEVVLTLSLSPLGAMAQGRSQAATAYELETDAIALKVKQKFAANEKIKKGAKPAASVTVKSHEAT